MCNNKQTRTSSGFAKGLTGVLKTQTTDLGIVIDVDKISAQNGGSTLTGGRIALELADYLKRPHESIGGHNEF